MRIFDKASISYNAYFYDATLTDGVSVAKALGKDRDAVFKTLVTVADNNEHFVFVIPVAQTLDLKKAAKAVGVKSVAMLKQKDLLPLTGYIHGGCSPVAMKKHFTTVIDETALLFDAICFSAGKVGCQVETSAKTLADLVGASFCDLTA